ncbi:MAG: sigma-54-dependent Fis family transcriptional regulator [Burkholderiales bacterium]|nr:sigma-54-dependent Fis family transcriptional regulator [Burkholderiales bacterium]
MTSLPLLIVEDDRDLRDALCITLELAGYAVIPAADGGEALTAIERRRIGLVISDIQMQPMDGLGLLREIKRSHAHIPVILMTAFGDIESAVAAMHAGASDYLAKPFEPAGLLQLVQRYRLQPVAEDDEGIVAADPKSAALLALAERVAASATTVLLSGESGTGKEVLARYIHRHSPRADQAFVAINCAAIPDNLIEATLFGHERGAFTGANQAQAGKFEQAQGGTLLLDEISEIPLPLQAKLLRVLQEREVERVGAKKALAIDIRVIATTNRDLGACVAAGTFREDLYYRLNVFPLQLLSLRERPADIVPLARRCVAGHAQVMGRPQLRLAASAEQALLAHLWPGNVRELENVVQRAVILAAGDLIDAAELDFGAAPAPQVAPQSERQAQGEAVTPGAPMDMKSLERAHIMETLLAVNGSRKLAVERLGISERALRYKLQQYRMEGGAA